MSQVSNSSAIRFEEKLGRSSHIIPLLSHILFFISHDISGKIVGAAPRVSPPANTPMRLP